VAGEHSRRPLRRLEQYIGIDGLALLRLYHREDASLADDVLAELRTLVEVVAGGERSEDVHGVPLDVAAGYARWATVYDDPGNALIAREEPTVHTVLESLEGEPVLDVGCGTGRHLAWLCTRNRRVIGVDQSVEMLERARAKVPDADLRVGTAVALPVEPASVAGVICALTLEHLPDLDAVFREFVRVVTPGGWIVTSCVHPLMTQVLGWNPWFRDRDGRGDVEHYPHSLSDYINSAVGAGLRVKECKEIPIDLSEPAPAEVRIGWPIAHDGLPLVLVMRFARP
jgi:SAM-dependent methyltransferase